MAALVISLILLAMADLSGATWCVCKEGLSDKVLQETLDYACGDGADCQPTHSKGPCFNPDTVRAHCNYAVNSFFQRKRQAPGTCDFRGAATLTNSDPSYAGCTYPSSASAAGSTSTMTPGTTNPKSTTLPVGNSPYSANPTTGILGGNGTDATGSGINPEYTNSGAFMLKNFNKNIFSYLFLITVSGLACVLS